MKREERKQPKRDIEDEEDGYSDELNDRVLGSQDRDQFPNSQEEEELFDPANDEEEEEESKDEEFNVIPPEITLFDLKTP